MDKPSPFMRELAKRLLAASQRESDCHVDPTAAVIENWRGSLIRFAGSEGFASLLRRALALAASEAPEVQDYKIGADGSLERISHSDVCSATDGVNEAKDEMDNMASNEAALAVTAHLLSLLVSFIGEPLTLKLVREAWPGAGLDKDNLTIEVAE